jgi:hypothetical protein
MTPEAAATSILKPTNVMPQQTPGLNPFYTQEDPLTHAGRNMASKPLTEVAGHLPETYMQKFFSAMGRGVTATSSFYQTRILPLVRAFLKPLVDFSRSPETLILLNRMFGGFRAFLPLIGIGSAVLLAILTWNKILERNQREACYTVLDHRHLLNNELVEAQENLDLQRQIAEAYEADHPFHNGLTFAA